MQTGLKTTCPRSLTLSEIRLESSKEVLERLSDLFIRRGVPDYVRSDNGPEFTAKRLLMLRENG